MFNYTVLTTDLVYLLPHNNNNGMVFLEFIKENLLNFEITLGISYSIVFVLCVFSGMYVLRHVTSKNNLFINLQFIQHNDFFNLVLVLVLTVVLISLYNILLLQTTSLTVLLCIGILFLQPVVILPIVYIFTFGMNTFLCVGLTQKKSIIGALINDYITTVSFLLRFFSQYIRIILILFVFVLLYEYLTSVTNETLAHRITGGYSSINSLLLVVGRLGFELLDCFFILTIQFNAFFIILLWLLSFLFILKFNNVFEY